MCQPDGTLIYLKAVRQKNQYFCPGVLGPYKLVVKIYDEPLQISPSYLLNEPTSISAG